MVAPVTVHARLTRVFRAGLLIDHVIAARILPKKLEEYILASFRGAYALC